MQLSHIYKKLLHHPHYYSFDQVCLLLDVLFKSKKPFGTTLFPQEESFHISSNIRLSHPACEVQKIVFKPNTKPIILINFLGFAGVQGPYPDEKFTKSLSYFMDLFHHRMAGLWVAARRIRHENLINEPMEKSVPGKLMEALSGQKIVPHLPVMPYFGILFAHLTSKDAIQAVLSSLLKNKTVEVQVWEGGWHHAISRDESRLKKRFSLLGKDFVLGKKSYNVMRGVHVSFYLAHFGEIIHYIPFAKEGKIIREMISFIFKRRMRVRLNITFDEKTTHPLRLQKGFYLGWNTFLGKARIPSVLIHE